MQIKTVVQVFVILLIAISAIAVTLNLYQNSMVSEALKKRALASEIVQVVNQRENIANNYDDAHHQESILQWQMMYDITVKLLQSKEFNTPEEQEILGGMREDNVAANDIFTRLILINQHQPISDQHPTEKQLVNQLTDKGESIIIGSYRLLEISQQQSKKIIRENNIFTLCYLGVFIILIAVILLILRIKIVAPLTELNRGLKILSAGDLDHRITSTSQDEINEIIDSFNSMATQLKCRTTEQLDINEKLATSNKELQQFAYITAHDLQEPLRSISSYLQLIESRYKGQIDKDVDEFIQYAVAGSQRLQNMINALLVYSRIETQPSPMQLTDLEITLKNAINNLQAAISENHAIITYDRMPEINVDRSQIEMLFQNLLSNAIKFHSNQPPYIHIGVHRLQHEWKFSVHDNGIGIDPKHHDQLFVVFKRLVGREYPGSGIGLAICKRIIDRHHGKIWVESEFGKGSTFHFTLPD